LNLVFIKAKSTKNLAFSAVVFLLSLKVVRLIKDNSLEEYLRNRFLNSTHKKSLEFLQGFKFPGG